MKRVIVAAVILWVILIFISYRATCQDSVRVYTISVKGSLSQFQAEYWMKSVSLDSMVRREVVKIDSLYYLQVSSWFVYSGGVSCFNVITPAPSTLSLKRKNAAYFLRSPFLIQ